MLAMASAPQRGCAAQEPGVQISSPARLVLLLGRPELLARLGLLDRNRLGRARRSGRPPCAWRCPRAARRRCRAAWPSPASAAAPCRSAPSPRAAPRPRAARRASRRRTPRCPPPRPPRPARPRGAARARRRARTRSTSSSSVLLMIWRYCAGSSPCCWKRRGGHVPHLVRLGVHQLVRHVDLGRGGHGVDGGLAELALDRVLLRLAQARADVLRQLVEGVEAAGLDRQVVVQLGQPLLLDLLDATRRRRPPCRPGARPGSRRGR